VQRPKAFPYPALGAFTRLDSRLTHRDGCREGCSGWRADRLPVRIRVGISIRIHSIRIGVGVDTVGVTVDSVRVRIRIGVGVSISDGTASGGSIGVVPGSSVAIGFEVVASEIEVDRRQQIRRDRDGDEPPLEVREQSERGQCRRRRRMDARSSFGVSVVVVPPSAKPSRGRSRRTPGTTIVGRRNQ
jgi:hypothetical protein